MISKSEVKFKQLFYIFQQSITLFTLLQRTDTTVIDSYQSSQLTRDIFISSEMCYFTWKKTNVNALVLIDL